MGAKRGSSTWARGSDDDSKIEDESLEEDIRIANQIDEINELLVS